MKNKSKEDIQRRLESLQRQRIKRKKKRKYERFIKLKKKKWKYKITTNKRIRYKSVIPPMCFSLIQNTEEILEYFEKTYEIPQNNKGINFDLSSVTDLSFDAIALLMTKIKSEKYWKNVFIKWCAPNEKKLQDMFISSWFYKHVQSDLAMLSTKWEMINNETAKKAVPDIAKKITDIAIEHSWVWQLKKSIYPTIIECMANTNTHAWKDYNWWLFAYKDSDTKITKICFIDLWIWIFQSMNSKIQKVLIALNTKSNTDILKDVLNWKIIIPSSTWELKRWKWIKFMYDFSKEENVKNFTIISNDVRANFSEDKFDTLSKSFSWTFVYWEIIPD